MRRGERVLPPCDRCRRLHMDCLKNLTACMGCTKKHAKCAWRDVRSDELEGFVRPVSTEPRGEIERDQDSMSPLSTVAELSRAIEERRNPEPSSPPQPEERAHPGETVPVVREESARPVSSARANEPAAAATTSPAPVPVTRPAPTESPQRPASTHRFDVRPPQFGHQPMDAGNRGSPPYRYMPMNPGYKDSPGRTIQQNENDEGDRLQALAAQVYRSASQSVKPQESS